MPEKYTAHVISHTHWDREWYKTFQQFRMRLVDLVDNLLDLLENNPEFKYWTFDGQTVVLKDYLEIRPENEERLRKLIQQGRILIGPWYVQPDEFLVSGENLIRNLLFGKRICEDFGNYMAVGYVPDEFGHISQLPQMLHGFGIKDAVFFRGITADQVKSEFTWQGADGSEVFSAKMPDNNAYSNWFYHLHETLRYPEKPIDPDEVTKNVEALMKDSIEEKPTTSQLLFMDGCDHVFPQFKTPKIITIVNEKLDNIEILHSTFAAFIDAVKNEKPELETYRGELRWSNRDWGLQAILANTLSSRVKLKQANHACETLLEKYVEPLCAWAWMLGEQYPKAYIDLAWDYMLKNSPHDSICGCSFDQVHTDMVYRYDQARMIGEALREKALGSIVERIGSEAENPDKTVLAAVFNQLSHKRTDVVEAYIDLPREWPVNGMKIIDSDGEEVPHAILGSDNYGLLEPQPFDVPPGTPRKKVRTIFLAKDVPPAGYKAYRVEALEKPNRQSGNMLFGPDSAENEYLAVTILSDGTFSLLDKETDAVYTSCLIFEDCGDFGDGYNYVKPLRDKVITSLGAKSKVSVVEDNAVRVIFEIDTDLELPESAHSNNEDRSERTVVCKAKTYVTLAAGVKRVDIRTVFDNQAKDHRLRVLFPTGLLARVSHAEGAFDVVERPISLPPCTDWREPLPHVHPQKTFVDISGSGIGLTLINKGLPEYEVRDDEARTMALTLLRATGSIGGQELGEHVFEYSLYPHAGNWEDAQSYRQGHEFNVPLIIGQTGIHEGDLPLEKSFIGVNGEAFVLSTVKKAENDEALVVRGFNIGSECEDVEIKVSGVESGELVNLGEDTIKPLVIDQETVCASIMPKQIVTCKLKQI